MSSRPRPELIASRTQPLGFSIREGLRALATAALGQQVRREQIRYSAGVGTPVAHSLVSAPESPCERAAGRQIAAGGRLGDAAVGGVG